MKTQVNQPQSNALAKSGDRVSVFGAMLERRKDELSKALDGRLSPDLVIRFMLTEMRKTPKLADCNDKSLFACLMQAAQFGLLPGGALQLIHFVPYSGEATPIIGYKGLRELALRATDVNKVALVDDIQSMVVYEKDEFDFAYGDAPFLTHKPSKDEDPGPIVAFYCIAWMHNSRKPFEVMWKRQVDAIRNRSQGYLYAEAHGRNSPWHLHYEEMGRKTVLRRLAKSLPTSIFPPEAHVNLDREDEREYRDAPKTAGRPAPKDELFGDALDAQFEPATEAAPEAPAAPASIDSYRAEIIQLHADLMEIADDVTAGDDAYQASGLTAKGVEDCNELPKLVALKNALAAELAKYKK
jgi:recombination protein RecT